MRTPFTRARVLLLTTVSVALATIAVTVPAPSRPAITAEEYPVRATALPDMPYTLRKQTPSATAFLHMNGDEPLRWDPCRAIHWVYNGQYAPPGGFTEVYQNFVLASEQTGFLFVYEGNTQERIGDYPDRAYLPDVYGSRWSPVLVQWEPSITAEDGTAVFGVAGPITDRTSAEPSYVSGTLRLNAEAFDGWINVETASRKREQGTVLHEIGHLLGLGHNDDPSSLMYPVVIAKRDTFSAADIAALRELADGTCDPDALEAGR